MDVNNLIQQIDEYLRAWTKYLDGQREAKASVPKPYESMDLAAHRTAFAIEMGILSSERVAEIRSALKFADRWNRE
jgi:hypothetical protein